MENQEKFIDMIKDIVALAKVNRHEVTKDFLDEFLKDLQLEETQMEFVYRYLMQENIKVNGYEVTEELSGEDSQIPEQVEESEYLSLYLQEVEQSGSKNEIDDVCYEKAASGDDQAKSYIVMQKQIRVIELAGTFRNKGLAQNDLIQEGNVGLLLAVEQLQEHKEDADAFIDGEIENAMLMALDEYSEDRKENRGLLRKAENLKDEMEKLSEDLGDKMTSDDVAFYTGMDLEEIQNILSMTGEGE